MQDPVEILIEAETVTVHNINQHLFHVGSAEKMKLLIGILKKYTFTRALIFTNTKQMCEEVAGRLTANGFSAEYLTGDLAQRVRQKRISQFKEGTIPIIVATDVAARGLHIDDLELVVNYDIPQYCENYVHRIGRTARAGKSGTAITLACERMIEHLAAIEKFIAMKIPASIADDELYADDASSGRSYRNRKKTPPSKSRQPSGTHRYRDQEQRPKRDFRKDGRPQKTGNAYRSRNTTQPVAVPAPAMAEAPPRQHIPHQDTPQTRKGNRGFISKITSFFK
jgi:ATP-dependent RNA helicase RhlB